MAKTLDYRIVVSEFELQLSYYIHFETNTLGKSINPMLNSITVVLQEGCISH